MIQSAADLHMHTTYSDGRPTVRKLLDHVARHTALRVIAITDHDTIEGAIEARVLAERYPFEVVVGEEVSSREGHILALYLEERIAPGMSARETIEAIHARGGVAIAAHPFITATTWGQQEVAMQGVGTLMSTLPFDAIEVENSTPLLEWANLRARRCNRRTCHLPEVGNSDAHIVEAVGKSYTVFPGITAADLRQAIAHGRIRAHGARYGVGDLLTYLHFYLETTLRPVPKKTPVDEPAPSIAR